MPIVILEESVANKIAAGEVVERPASVVKELIENSLDAGARQVTVELEDGGRRLIQVTDDGGGMSREDAVLSLQRHATSKIATADDLFAIRTLGFRGEALPSIASVSVLTLTTRLRGEPGGVRLAVEGGVIRDLEEVGAPEGTRVSVARLFYNTPARLKFLRSESTELAHCADLIERFTFSHTGVSFRLLHNGREVLNRPATGNLLVAMAAAYGREAGRNLAPVTLALPTLRVSGYVSGPELSRGNRAEQSFFVNGRWVKSRIIGHALDAVYRELLPPGRHPVAVLMLEIEPQLVDVNVHPTKAEVRFDREWEVHAALVRALREAAGAGRLGPQATLAMPSGRTFGPPLGERRWPGGDPFPRQADLGLGQEAPGMPAPPPAPVARAGLRALGQLHNTFIVAESADGLLIIDQHRAHERVLYERLAAKEGQVESQRLVMPVTVHLGHAEADALEQHLEHVRALGLEVEPFGGESYVVRAVPAAMAHQDPGDLLREVVAALLAPGGKTGLPRERILAGMACKAAVKAGQVLAPHELAELAADLSRCSLAYTCPHGHPVVMTIAGWELARKFNR